MNLKQPKLRIAIIGGGPAALFLFKQLLEDGNKDFTVTIFEAKATLGAGFPYSNEGAAVEHITNVSGNEIPNLVQPITEWITTLSSEELELFNINPEKISDYKVFPRLLFGHYLQTQFNLLLQKATEAGIETTVHLNNKVTDIIDIPGKQSVQVEVAAKDKFEFDKVIICTGHSWPAPHEGKTPGYFDSPYPPAKIAKRFNHAVALKGSALTAIDAIRTLAKHNGSFIEEAPHQFSFAPGKESADFKIVMYSLKGLLPAVRFHLDDTHLSPASLLSKEAIAEHIAANNGFLSLDFIFEKDFKEILRKKDPSFYQHIKDMSMEAFVGEMMAIREQADPFSLLKAEYEEARLSIKRKQSVYWKELLGALSFAMNYPAKHLSAEDMLRLQKTLMPLISIVIAYVPQSSCEEILALYEAGRLEINLFDKEAHVEVKPGGGVTYHHTDKDGKEYQNNFETFVDCTGQKHLQLEDFPFKSLVSSKTLTAAMLKFKSVECAIKTKAEGNTNVKQWRNNDFYLKVPGIAITDNFAAVDKDGTQNECIYIMAVPFIGGYNPDYAGLDFCEEASSRIVEKIFLQFK